MSKTKNVKLARQPHRGPSEQMSAKKAARKAPAKKRAVKKATKKTAKKKAAKPAKKAAKNKGGRPKIEINEKQVEELAQIGCTLDEIGHVVGCSRDTLERRFAAIIDKGRNGGKTRLRKAQMTKALAGNVPLLIFLGKNILKQSDKIANEHTGPDGKPIAHTREGQVTLNLTMNQPAEEPWKYGEDTEQAESQPEQAKE